MILLTVFHILETYLAYEIVVGLQVINNTLLRTGKKHGYVPPSILHSRGREDYLEWKEWKGEKF